MQAVACAEHPAFVKVTAARARRAAAALLRIQTTSVLTATTLIYATGAGITAAAGTRLALQSLLGRAFAAPSFQLHKVHRYFLSLPPRVGIGQFARLLPSLDVVAVSQAPSPESNPYSPLPVVTMVGLDPTIHS